MGADQRLRAPARKAAAERFAAIAPVEPSDRASLLGPPLRRRCRGNIRPSPRPSITPMAASDASQEKPDFSGEWVLNRGGSTLSAGADTVRSGLWHIEHREPTFRQKAAFVFESGSRDYEYELLCDGREAVSTHEGGRTMSSARWEGSALVVTFRTEHPGGAMTVCFRFELLDAGRRLRAAEALRGTDHDQDNVWIFERR